MGLPWGRRYLMCPPDHYRVAYEINPWMHRSVAVDPERAREQWEALRRALVAAGASVELLDPEPSVPDLIFTANAGIVDGDRYVPSRFHDPERQAEEPFDVAWFTEAGFAVTTLDSGMTHEGAGDALPFFPPDGKPVLLSGYRTRSHARAHAALSRVLGVGVLPIELVDPRLYHLDLTFCPLDERRAMVAPGGWDRYGCSVVENLVPETLELTGEDAYAFVANSVVVGPVVIMPACPVTVGRRLEAWGFTVEVVDMGEFEKAGGACRCLTLALDVSFATSG